MVYPIPQLFQLRGIGKAGKALKTVLDDYSISQTQLVTVLGIGRSHRYGWVNQTRDSNSETAIAIIQSLEEINVDTATEFRRLYLD